MEEDYRNNLNYQIYNPVYTTNISNMNNHFTNSYFSPCEQNTQYFNLAQPVQTKQMTKRGRGKGSRGSYRPRGKVRHSAHTSSNRSYVSTQAQKVCINPEILKQLGYNPSSNF